MTTGTGTFDDPNIIHPIYTPPAGELGTFTFTLVAYGLTPCANDTSTVQLTIFDGPEADYTINPADSICVDEVIAFDCHIHHHHHQLDMGLRRRAVCHRAERIARLHRSRNL